MRTHREMPWLWRSLVSIACTLPASACVDAIVGEVDVCEYEGKGYRLNEEFKDKDGCNDCTCTLQGEVECTTKECGPVLGCDEKYGCHDAGAPYADAGPGKPVCDPKLGCDDAGAYLDAGGPAQSYCKHNGATYKPGESFRDDENCSRCVCQSDGVSHCEKLICFEPDGAVAPGTCEYAGKVYMPGASFPSGDNCDKCQCTESGVVECTVGGCNTDAGVSDGGYSDAGSAATGYCQYQGVQYPVGAGFARADTCNKCTCVANGQFECSNIPCTRPPGCLIGSQLVQVGDRVICEDGCNTCTCQMDGKFLSTERACPALPTIGKCSGSADALQIPAALVYQTGDALFVSESRCVNGQTNDFGLCYDDLASTMGNEVTVYMVAGSGTRACGLGERVFSIAPLREDYLATFSGRTGGKIVLRGTGTDFLYQFGM